jgi:hypothetical protein
MKRRCRSGALAVAVAAVLASAGCGGAGGSGGAGGASNGPSPGASPSASGAPMGTAPGAVPTGTSVAASAPSDDDVSRALVATMENDLGMSPSQAECVQRKITPSLAAGDKAAVVAGWRKVVGTTPRPIVVPPTVINAARVAVTACAASTGAPGQVHVTPVR